jgi:DNA ligase (NAD+)
MNEVIPKVVRVATKHSQSTFKLPTTCPACGLSVAKPEGLVDCYCDNPSCSAQLLAKLVHGTGKTGLDLDGCGEQVCADLVSSGVRRLSDVFTVDPKLKPAALARFLAGREAALRQPFWRKLSALCIEGIGQNTCQELAARYTGFGALLDALAKDKQKLSTFLGTYKLNSLIHWLSVNCGEIEALYAVGLFSDDTANGAAVNANIAGKSFCITGNLCCQRQEAERMVLEAGGLAKSSVSKKVDYLVVGENSGANKTRDAARLGTKCLSEDEFWDLLGTRPRQAVKTTIDHEY